MFPQDLQTANIFSEPTLLVLIGLVVVMFGGKKLGDIGKGLGEGIKNFKDAIKPEDSAAPKKEEEVRKEEEIKK